MTGRTSLWLVLTGAACAGLLAGLIPPPAALAGAGVSTTRVFAALASTALVSVALIPLSLRSARARRTLWIALAATALAAGIGAFTFAQSTARTCTASYDGRAVLVGTEWTALGERYVADNPGLSRDDLLLDAAGVADRVWTAASIDGCRRRLAASYALWVPCLAVCLLAAMRAASGAPLAPPASTARAGAGSPNGTASPPSPAVLRYDAFISYRHGGRDGEVAREIVEALERDGYTVAIDERDFPPNASFLQEMERCVRESRFTIALVSSRYLGSGHCEEEAILCKVLDMSDRTRRLVPLILERVELPAWLFGLVGIDCTASDPLVDPFDRLRAVLGRPMTRA